MLFGTQSYKYSLSKFRKKQDMPYDIAKKSYNAQFLSVLMGNYFNFIFS